MAKHGGPSIKGGKRPGHGFDTPDDRDKMHHAKEAMIEQLGKAEQRMTRELQKRAAAPPHADKRKDKRRTQKKKRKARKTGRERR